MAEPFGTIDAETVRRNLDEVRSALPAGVRVLCAAKYVGAAQMPALAEAGIELVGENRLQDLEAKQELCGELFEWHFIGRVQSRKAAKIAERVALIHSLATESALEKLEGAAASAAALIQVNVAGEGEKEGIRSEQLGEFIARCPLPVIGLSTMPPAIDDPERSRRHFARLAELAAEHGLAELSMGTSQDWRVAAEEGATIVRLGTSLLR